MHDPLSDIEETEAIPDETPSPDDLSREAEEPATVAYVKRELDRRFGRHRGDCAAQRAVRKWRLWIAAGIGAALVVQFGWLLAGRAIIRETVRDVVREELAGRLVARAKPPVSLISTAEASETKVAPAEPATEPAVELAGK
jgi:hypothetical protein